MLIKWLHMLSEFSSHRKGGVGEERRWVTESGRGKKVEAEGKAINQEAWSPQDWEPNGPGPNQCLLLLTPGPHPRHFPHVLESLS